MGRTLRALVVDDSETNRILIKEMLGDKFECEEADNGFAALDLYTKSVEGSRYDVMLLDIAMPQMDGIQLLKIIREKEKEYNRQRLPIVVVTAQMGSIDKAKAAGCDDYLFKPLEARLLLEKLDCLAKSLRP